MRFTVLLTLLFITLCGCNTLKMVSYKVKVTPDVAEGVTFYAARNNGLSDWDGQECSQCELAFTKMENGYKVLHCDFNVGLRKIVSKTGDSFYEMELVHYGDEFVVPSERNSLVFEVDGQLMGFAKNDDADGIFYDVTLDQLQEICSGKKVLVQIIGMDGPMEKAFTWENRGFFQRFLYDPNADGLPQPTPTQGGNQKFLNTKTIDDGTDDSSRHERKPLPRKNEDSIQ